jgi:F-type H+-transporting ATPase subunit epsilon
MLHTLTVRIVTPRTTAYDGTALAVSVPGAQAPFQVLFNHAPIISALEPGVVKIEDANNAIEIFATKEGFVEVLKNVVTIVVNELVPVASISQQHVESQRLEARSVADTHPDRTIRQQARKELQWADAQLQALRAARGS